MLFWESKNKNKEIETEYFDEENILEFKDFNLWTHHKKYHILKNVNIKIKKNSIVAIIGSSGSGKSSLLHSINKANLEKERFIYDGKIFYEGKNIYNPAYPLEFLRTQIGTIFQKPIIFPMSIEENILYALKAHQIYNDEILKKMLRKSLEKAYLWSEVSHRLTSNPSNTLSLGQQQRLCIARAIALKPKILLMDEPTSALDPKSSNEIEKLILEMSEYSTIIIVSHSLSQVKRISQYTFFLKNGEIIEYGTTKQIFTNPKKKETRKFITGEY